MAINTFLAGTIEDIGDACVITPGNDSDILNVFLQKVAWPADVSLGPRPQAGAAQSVDQDDIGSAGAHSCGASADVVNKNDRPDAVERRTDRLRLSLYRIATRWFLSLGLHRPDLLSPSEEAL